MNGMGWVNQAVNMKKSIFLATRDRKKLLIFIFDTSNI